MARSAALIAVVLVLHACVPFPSYSLIQPELEIVVIDSNRDPIEGASVLFVAASNPHRVTHNVSNYLTDREGTVRLHSDRDFEWVFPFMMHGVPFYFWTWCTEKDGYFSQITEVHDISDLDGTFEVMLHSGESDGHCALESGILHVSTGDT